LIIKPLFSGNYFSSKNKFLKIANVIKSYFCRGFLIFNLLIFNKKYQLILIEYELFPFSPSVFEYLLKKRGIKYIVDYDDAIFHKYDEHKSNLVRFLFRKKIARVMKYAQTVIVGNSYLRDYAQKYNTHILLLPTVVVIEKYLEKSNNKNIENVNTVFIIGWIGSKSTSPYLLNILPALEKFVKHNNAQCHFIGFDETLLSKQELDQCHIKVIGWHESTEIHEMKQFDVGIMPLSNDNWSKGKCGFKLIQYMACKKPVIASPVGANKQIVKNGINGYLVETNEQWQEVLLKLYNNPSLRQEISENNMTEIKNNYNIHNNCEKYIQLIKSLG